MCWKKAKLKWVLLLGQSCKNFYWINVVMFRYVEVVALFIFFFPNENSICTNVGWISQTILSIGNEKHENWVQMYSFLMLGC